MNNNQNYNNYNGNGLNNANVMNNPNYNPNMVNNANMAYNNQNNMMVNQPISALPPLNNNQNNPAINQQMVLPQQPVVNQNNVVVNQPVSNQIPNNMIDNTSVMPGNNVLPNTNDGKMDVLNVDGAYNGMEKAPEYVNDMMKNQNLEPKKKNTVPISKELKTVILITAVLFLFIVFMPMLSDAINKMGSR